MNLSGLWMCDASADRQPGRYQYPGCALLATALLHVLLLGTPRPFTFFAWITGLADVVAAAAPFT